MKTDFGQANCTGAVGVKDVGDGKQDEADAEAGRVSTPESLPEYDTKTLFAGGREIVIHHAGAAYRMKITKQGKLILNK